MYPDFLGIGAQRAGTSWLDANLRFHPGIWMPPLKELHYFGNPSSRRLITRVFIDRRPETKARLRMVLRREGRKLMKLKGERPLWWLRFFFLRRSDHWYGGLFSPGPGQIAGEVTPEYATLEERVVARIYSLMPGARIIYLLRNPIDRAWSQAAMHFRVRHRRSLDTIRDEEIKEFLEGRGPSKHADYVKNLQVWERFYSPPQIFVGFYEQLVRDPQALLREIYQFLGVDGSDRFIPKTVHIKRATRPYPPIPDHFAHSLARRFYEGIEQTHERFANSHTAGWVEAAKRMLGSPIVS